MRFSRKNRLLTTLEFKALFDNAKKISEKHLLILHMPNHTNSARLGLVVGKRVASSAVKRNRIKRIIRESFRQQDFVGTDIIVIARHLGDQLSKQKLREGIEKLWQKLRNSL